MRETIQDIITRLLRYQHAPEKTTSLFRTLKHNADLLPRLQAVLETTLQAYGKFEEVVYDIQGPRDDGSDVVLRCRKENGEAESGKSSVVFSKRRTRLFIAHRETRSCACAITWHSIFKIN